MLINPFWFTSSPIISSNYIFQEDFEEAGMPVNFTEYNGTQVRDYDYAINPLQGSQSFRINSNTTSTPRGNIFSYAFNNNAFSVYFMWRRQDDPSAIAAIWQKLRALDNTVQNGLSIDSSTMSLILRNGNSINGVGSYAVASNTTYHIWIDVLATTGNVQAFINTSDTKPSTPTLTQDAFNNNSSPATETGAVVFTSMRNMDCVFDKIRIKINETIGSNPT